MYFVIFLLLLTFLHALPPPKTYSTIVYGATPAGIAAAISATSNGANRVALIEPSPNLGGMSVAGGIGLRDIPTTYQSTLGGIGLEWALLNGKYYGVDYAVLQPDMFVGELSYKIILEKYGSVEVFFNRTIEVDGVVKDGTNIVSIVTEEVGNPQMKEEWKATFFIDASYEGDLVRFAKASYTYGRESQDQYNETYAGVQAYTTTGNFLKASPVKATYDNGTLLPYVNAGPLLPVGSADDHCQAYSFRLCITKNKTNQNPFPRPINYDPSSFLLLQRYITTLLPQYPKGPPFSYIVSIFPYRSYPRGDKWDLCDSPVSAFTSDAPGIGQGWVTGTWEQRRGLAKMVYNYEAGMIWFLLNDPSVPQGTRDSVAEWGLCKDEWVSNGNWPPQLYVREGLRLVGDKVMTESDVLSSKKCINNSIAVGAWVVDIHVVQRVAVLGMDGKTLVANNEGQVVASGSNEPPYEVPYSVLLPKREEVSNLLVPVCNSASHVAYGSIRVEPTFVQLGQAAGTATAVGLSKGILVVQDVPVADIQESLIAQGVHIHTSGCK